MVINEDFVSFIYSATTLNIYSSATEYPVRFYLPSLLSETEHTVCRLHFALTLDALLDMLFRQIFGAMTVDAIETERRELDRLRMQVGLFLDELSQYVKIGQRGTEIAFGLREVFQSEEIENRVIRKINLTESLIQSGRERIVFSDYEKVREKNMRKLEKMLGKDEERSNGK